MAGLSARGYTLWVLSGKITLIIGLRCGQLSCPETQMQLLVGNPRTLVEAIEMPAGSKSSERGSESSLHPAHFQQMN